MNVPIEPLRAVASADEYSDPIADGRAALTCQSQRGNRVRRATVEREIAKTELTQAKAEIEELYSAQRKRKEESAQAVGGDDTLRAELDERETRISSLGVFAAKRAHRRVGRDPAPAMSPQVA